MASIGKITSSAISIPNELTLAAAAFNFDFTLVKLEAPPSFHGVRDALSKRRRNDAEEGIPHMTARRLGALFESKVPSIHNLIETYGTRVSEICAACDGKAASAQSAAGMFKTQTGPDGTSIWAGATSGSAALAVHLLACFLARMWQRHEAISIWVELVERRKQEIQSRFTGGNPTELTAMMAAQQVITREQLGNWDASARSWLQTADSAKRVQQTQLMLIINNLSIPVNTLTDPYESVMKGWVSALETMERLTQGIPQRVYDGAILLAVSSWHLYLDMDVLVDGIKHVDQKDELMRVFWSLPLSRMRFYHPPEVTDRRLAPDTSRVTVDEFLIVMLGAVVGKYEEEHLDISEFCTFIYHVYALCASQSGGNNHVPPWLHFVHRAAVAYLGAHSVESIQKERLFRLGRRRGSKFLSTNGTLLYHLFDFDAVFSMIEEAEPSSPGEGPRKRIAVLRNIAQTLNCPAEELIIRYRTPSTNGLSEPAFSFASAVPIPTGFPKRMHDSRMKKPSSGHVRFIVASISVPKRCCSHHQCTYGTGSSFWCSCHGKMTKCTEYCHLFKVPCNNFESAISLDCIASARKLLPVMEPLTLDFTSWSDDSVESERGWSATSSSEHGPQQLDQGSDAVRLVRCSTWPYCTGCYNRKAKEYTDGEKEICQLILPMEHHAIDQNRFRFSMSNSLDPATFEFVRGDINSAALFKKTGTGLKRKHPRRGEEKQENKEEEEEEEEGDCRAQQSPSTYRTFALWDLEQVLFRPDISMDKLQGLWHRDFSASPQGKSLSALAFASTLYEELSDVTINLEVLDVDLSATFWAQDVDSSTLRPSFSKRSSLAFACLGLFDSGHYDIHPNHLTGVFAMSTCDSIYVLSSLLEDPAERGPLVKHVFGNLGRAGMCFLTSIGDPRLDGYSPSHWRLVNHHPFDGKFGNSFAGTSLHLSYTDYEIAIDIGKRGLRDHPVNLVEAIITLDENGTRLGDLDVDALIDKTSFPALPACEHDDSTGVLSARDEKKISKLVSIDCWDELFDSPTQQAVFRATGNWEARLAAVAATAQMKKTLFLLPESPCLKCLAEAVNTNKMNVIIA